MKIALGDTITWKGEKHIVLAFTLNQKNIYIKDKGDGLVKVPIDEIQAVREVDNDAKA